MEPDAVCGFGRTLSRAQLQSTLLAQVSGQGVPVGVRKQPLKAAAHCAVALAGRLLQAGTIRHGDHATTLSDQACLLKPSVMPLTVDRCTPSISARNSCVSGTVSWSSRSCMLRIQRQQRASTL